MKLHVAYYQSPIGLLEVKGSAEAIISIRFVEEEPASSATADASVPSLIASCIDQLDEYFRGMRSAFTVPLQPWGSPFQQKVWNGISSIPFGSTVTYKQLAVMVNNPAAARAAGHATGKNRFAILVPCHRIVGSDGKRHGYAWGVWRKEWLIDHERKVLQRSHGMDFFKK
jgi:methylated-DNA-[protein]-cysteine S-methyltransferase